MGKILIILSYIVYVVTGLIGLILCLGYLMDYWGTFWTVVSFFVFPIALYVTPLIALFKDGDWTLLLINYGGALVFGLLMLFGRMLSKED